MRIGILGGTFDPPHLGHLILAEEACYRLGLAQVLFVLTPDPPHKKGVRITPVDIRLELLSSALREATNFIISRVDIDRQPPHYAVDTVNITRQNFPGNTLVYLLGGDSLQDLPTWHTPVDFVASCDEIGVMSRPEYRVDLPDLETRIPGITEKVRFINAPLLEISSTDIRRRIASGEPYRFYLPEVVWKIIQSRHLYHI